MSKFTFGTPTTTASAPSFGFSAATPAAGGFGANTTFGTGAAQTAAQTATPGLNFSFGSTPAATAQPTNLTLGAGTTAPGGSLFSATPQAQPVQQTQLGQLGQPAQSTGLTFGTPAAKPAGLTFGTPANTGGLGATGGLTTGNLTTGALGTTAGLGTSGSLGTTGALGTTGGLITGGGLGGTGGLSFGTPATTGSLSFGTSTTGAATGSLSFGAATSTTTGGLNFGTTSTAGGLSFGTTTSSAAPTLTSSAPLSFGATAATTSTSSLFGATSGGLFGAKPAASVAVVTTTTTATTANRGLGGLDVSITNKGLTQGSASPTAAKENILPNELMQTIDGFKEFVKTQKVLSSDIARGSARPLNRCAEDTASLMEILTTLAGSVQRDRSLADKLKQDTAKALQNAEIAQRTHDTPAGLQYENNAPLLFFMELAENFEHDLMLFKSQIETTEKHIQTMMTPKTLTPQELTMAMSKLHESLVAVAGRLQGVHSKVQQQKEQYLNFRKYVLKDSTNVFEDIKTDRNSSRSSIGKVTSGPTPFGPGNRSFLSSTALNASQTPSYGTSNPLVWGNVTTTPAANLSMGTSMKPPTTGLSFNPPTNLTAPLSTTDPNSSFQLQKPPVGNKRGKH